MEFFQPTCLSNNSLSVYLKPGSDAPPDIMHLLDRAESDIRFVVQIEADVGRSEAESNFSLNLHDKSNVRQGSVQRVFCYAESIE